MIIPSNEISKPGIHADEIGYTFIWEGHFLRGIFPESVPFIRSLFDSGLIEKLEEERLFPKTVVSDFENEQFGVILEHEFIKPIVLANEWNYQMLYDAALMVVRVAQIAWDYGYNMIDCHKTNVMFTKNRPIYVDIGSFVQRENGSTGWWPYLSFKQSYLYILSLWNSGAGNLAKRLLSQGVLFDEKEYYLWRYPIFRKTNFILDCFLSTKRRLNLIAVLGYEKVIKKGRMAVALKRVLNSVRFTSSQSLHRLERKIRCLRLNVKSTNSHTLSEDIYDSIFKDNPYESVVLVDSESPLCAQYVSKINGVKSVISIHNNSLESCEEYLLSQRGEFNMLSLHYNMMNPLLQYNKYPENRFKSDIVIVVSFMLRGKRFGIHNFMVSLNKYMDYSSLKRVYVIGAEEDLMLLSLSMEGQFITTINSMEHGSYLSISR